MPFREFPRDRYHLKGTSSILRASMNTSFVDPSASTLHDAAFWIYVRQCMYNSTISQEPLDIDFSLSLSPTSDTIFASHPLTWLQVETTWANEILWITAGIANFCFSQKITDDTAKKAATWQELWDKNQSWQSSRPTQFDAIGSGPTEDGDVFPGIWFSADWHGKLPKCFPTNYIAN